jgi:HD-GYP domain-containing protein (c-di-GMP phosphodiesterase class II)
LTPFALFTALVLLGVFLVVGRNLVDARRQTALKDHTLELVAQTLDAPDRNTESHSTRVAELAGQLGEHMGLGERECDLLRTAGSVHDLGKIGIRDDILCKPGPLTEDEWKIMRRHPDIAADMIEKHSALGEVALLVRHHHERWDGSGYPAGQKGTNIPIGARIIAVAESFDMITHEFVFRANHLTAQEAIRDINEHSGSWYDPEVVDSLRALHAHPLQNANGR